MAAPSARSEHLAAGGSPGVWVGCVSCNRIGRASPGGLPGAGWGGVGFEGFWGGGGGAGWGAVASEDFGAVGAAGGGGAVRVQGDGPAPPVNHRLVVIAAVQPAVL